MAATTAQQHHRSTLTKYLRSQTSRTAESSGLQVDKGSKKSKAGPSYLKERARSQISFQSDQSSSHEAKRSLTSLKGRYATENGAIGVKLPHIPRGYAGRRKATAESLPDEILSCIFWKLPVGDLINASQVCRRWHRVAGDNLLWKQYYAKFVGPTNKEMEDKMPVHELSPHCWKNLCLWRCKIKRDQIYLKKWKQPDSYTGLKQRPEFTLGKVGVRFELSLINSEGIPHTMQHSDIFWFNMATNVRWYELVFPDIKDIHCIKVHACSPLMFYGPAKPAKDGIVQKSLLRKYKGSLRDALQKQKAIGSDTNIQLFELAKGLMVAKYQADGEIAFLACSLHCHNLISRCLCGSPNRCWMPSIHQVPEDDIDPQYGLHHYTCVLLVRNMRQKLLECKFTDLHTTRQALKGGFATFKPVRRQDKGSHVSLIKNIAFPWKTTLFKGIIEDVGILDVTVLDERGEPFWTVSSAVSVEQSTQTSQFDFDPKTYRVIRYQDETGKIHLEIGMLDDGSQYLSSAAIALSVAAINETFHTAY